MGGSIGAAVVGPRCAASTAPPSPRSTASGLAARGDVVERLAASPLAGRVANGALQGPLVEALAVDLVRYRVADRLLSEGLVEQTTARARWRGVRARGPGRARERDERLIASAIESRLLDQAVARLLESDDLWLVVDDREQPGGHRRDRAAERQLRRPGCRRCAIALAKRGRLARAARTAGPSAAPGPAARLGGR